MFNGLLKIALLCIVVGAASIPLSFGINSSPFVVWFGNALGSIASALFVIFISERVMSGQFKGRISKGRMGRKVITIFDEGDDNKKVVRVRFFVNRHGLRVFSFLCPIFPGVFISTAAVYLLGLDRKLYKKWMLAGVFFASGAYVWAYWFTFVRPH